MGSPKLDGYLGVDTREYHPAVWEEDLVVIGWSDKSKGGYSGKMRLALTVESAKELRSDLDNAISKIEDSDTNGED
jgi:hypothetical protein